MIETVNLADRLTHKPKELSGGQQQRVAIARALVSRPRIVFADEPTGNLDSRSGAEVLDLLRSSVDDHGQTVVIVTHDPVAAAYCDRVLFLADGRIVEELRDPTRDVGPRGHGPVGRARRLMIKAALKSLLGRKVRLLLSTFAIVLGVAFVSGTLVFSDTLNRSFTALFASTVGDVVVQPVGALTENGTPSANTLPGSLVDELEQVDGVARVDGNVNAFGVYVVGEDGKVVGGLGPPSIGEQLDQRPVSGRRRPRDQGRRSPPEGQHEVLLDERTAEKAGYQVGDTVKLLLPRGTAQFEAELVGLLCYPEGGSLNGATLTLWDTRSAQELFQDGEDVYNDVWVTAEDGVSQDELRDAVEPVLPGDVEAVTGDQAADDAADDLLEAIGFITTFLLVFAGIALVVGAFIIVNTFSILVAQRSRELALLRALGASRTAGDLVGPARGVRRRRARCRRSVWASASCWRCSCGCCSGSSASTSPAPRWSSARGRSSRRTPSACS